MFLAGTKEYSESAHFNRQGVPQYIGAGTLKDWVLTNVEQVFCGICNGSSSGRVGIMWNKAILQVTWSQYGCVMCLSLRCWFSICREVFIFKRMDSSRLPPAAWDDPALLFGHLGLCSPWNDSVAHAACFYSNAYEQIAAPFLLLNKAYFFNLPFANCTAQHSSRGEAQREIAPGALFSLLGYKNKRLNYSRL